MLPGVDNHECSLCKGDADGVWRLFTGTRNRAETKRMAWRIEDEYRQIRMGYKPLNKLSDYVS